MNEVPRFPEARELVQLEGEPPWLPSRGVEKKISIRIFPRPRWIFSHGESGDFVLSEHSLLCHGRWINPPKKLGGSMMKLKRLRWVYRLEQLAGRPYYSSQA